MNLKSWLKSPAAASAFWSEILAPFMKKHSTSSCRAILETPGKKINHDTAWALHRMARTPGVADSPDKHDAEKGKHHSIGRFLTLVSESQESVMSSNFGMMLVHVCVV